MIYIYLLFHYHILLTLIDYNTIRMKKEIYYLNEKEYPTIPVPGDCIVKEIQLKENYLIFIFEDDITYHDGTKKISPDTDTKSLIIKFHLLNDIYDICLFMKSQQNTATYTEIEVANNKEILHDITKNRLAYLHHYIGYCSMIIKLWSEKDIVFDLYVDYVEFDWI